MEIKNLSLLGQKISNMLSSISSTIEGYTVPFTSINKDARKKYKEFSDLNEFYSCGHRIGGNGNSIAIFLLKSGKVVVLHESEEKIERFTYKDLEHCYYNRDGMVRHLLI